MNVYVESNFVLEHALEQEQCESCEQLIALASAGGVQLIIPAFSLAEPSLALAGKEKTRQRLGHDLQAHLSDLGRSRSYREIPGNFSELASVLIGSAERERRGLAHTIDTMLRSAHLIPLDAEVFFQAAGIQVGQKMSTQDSIVLASVVSHLTKTKPAESCFLNRNTKDFDDPNIRELLGQFACKFFGRFDEGLRYVEACLR